MANHLLFPLGALVLLGLMNLAYGGEALSIRFVLPAGETAREICVYRVADRATLIIDERLAVREPLDDGIVSLRTDREGALRLEDQTSGGTLVAIEPEGYYSKRVELLEDGEAMRLSRWGRIEGQVVSERRSVDEKIGFRSHLMPYYCFPRDFCPVRMTGETAIDSEGRFRFERVVPEPVEVFRTVRVSGDSEASSETHLQRVNVAPGATSRVELARPGWTISGRFEIENYDGEPPWRCRGQSIIGVQPAPQEILEIGRLCKEPESRTREGAKRIRAAIDRFFSSKEGLTYNPRKRFTLEFRTDGGVVGYDIPPGDYAFDILLAEKSSIPTVPWGVIAQFRGPFQVPALADGRSEIELGIYKLKARQALRVGSQAPDFDVPDFKGGRIKPSDFRGKFVLLDFWAMTCAPCLSEMPFLKGAFEAHRDNPNFAMVGLHLDPSPTAARQHVAEWKYDWIHGQVGEWSGPLAWSYRVEGIPALFLIGPDGRIVANRLRGLHAKGAVEAALAATK